MHLFTPQKSRLYRIYLILTHVFSAFCFLTLRLSPALLFFFVISFLYYFFRQEEIIALQYDKKTDWILAFSSAHTHTATLLGSSVMLSHLLILHFKLVDDPGRKTVVFFSDSFPGDEFKTLRRSVRAGYL